MMDFKLSLYFSAVVFVQGIDPGRQSSLGCIKAHVPRCKAPRYPRWSNAQPPSQERWLIRPPRSCRVAPRWHPCGRISTAWWSSEGTFRLDNWHAFLWERQIHSPIPVDVLNQRTTSANNSGELTSRVRCFVSTIRVKILTPLIQPKFYLAPKRKSWQGRARSILRRSQRLKIVRWAPYLVDIERLKFTSRRIQGP